jgi:hypothetical protein
MAPSGHTPAGGEREELIARIGEKVTTAGARVLMTGEAGIGKSTVLDRVVASAQERSPILFARARQYDQHRFRGLRDLMQDVEAARFAALPAAERTALLHVLDRSPANGPVAPGAVAAGVTHFLARLAADGGILAVDDWQWLDVGAAFREPRGDRPAEAATRLGHECRPPGEGLVGSVVLRHGARSSRRLLSVGP